MRRQKQGALAARKDAKLDAVVISERYDKKAAKFSAPSLPYPYNSKEAFESSMRQPLGNEFNTHTSFRSVLPLHRGSLPRLHCTAFKMISCFAFQFRAPCPAGNATNC